MKHRGGIDLANGGQETADNARRSRDIGEIIHLPSEDDVRPGVAFQGLVRRNCQRIELPGIDPISQRFDGRARKIAHPTPEEFGLLFAHQERMIGKAGEPPFLGREKRSFPAIDGRHRPSGQGRIGFELGGIDIDEVDNRAARPVWREIHTHLTGKNVNRPDWPGVERPGHISFQFRAVECRLTDGTPPNESLDACDNQRLGPAHKAMAGRHSRQFRLHQQIGIAFSEGRDMDRRDPRQRFQDMVRPDLVAPIRWKRNAVSDKQDFRAGSHPNPRAIKGPKRFVNASGSRFQRAIRAEWPALPGSVSRGLQPGAVQLAYSSGSGSKPQFFLNA